MNKFELDKTMECLGYKADKDFYLVKGCKFYHDGFRYFTGVYGNIPRDLAKLIYEKYDNNKYKIRVEGAHENAIPVGNVRTYHVDTIEGLVALILELKNYKIKDVSSEELEEALQLIYKKILKSVDADVSVYDWMLDRENRKEYFKTLFEHNTLLDLRLRKKIVEFDNVVNPFYNNQLDMDDNSFIVNGIKCTNGESRYSLTDKESGISLYTNKSENGFVVKLFVPSESNEICIYHYYDGREEKVAFEKYDYSNGITRLEYNMTNDTFGKAHEDKNYVKVEDKKFVIKSLEEYITITKGIVSKNIGSEVKENSSVLKRTE